MADLKNTIINGDLVVDGEIKQRPMPFETALWSDIVANVKAGLGPSLYPIGSKKRGEFVGVTGAQKGCTFIVLDYDNPADMTATGKSLLEGQHIMSLLVVPDKPITSAWSSSSGNNRGYAGSYCSARVALESLLNNNFVGGTYGGSGSNGTPNLSDILPRTLNVFYSYTNSSKVTFSQYTSKIFIPACTELRQSGTENVSYYSTSLSGSGIGSIAIIFNNPYRYCIAHKTFYTNNHINYWTRSPVQSSTTNMVSVNQSTGELISSYYSAAYIVLGTIVIGG